MVNTLINLLLVNQLMNCYFIIGHVFILKGDATKKNDSRVPLCAPCFLCGLYICCMYFRGIYYGHILAVIQILTQLQKRGVFLKHFNRYI